MSGGCCYSPQFIGGEHEGQRWEVKLPLLRVDLALPPARGELGSRRLLHGLSGPFSQRSMLTARRETTAR